MIYYIFFTLSLLIAHGDDNHSHGHGHGNHTKISLKTGSIEGTIINSDNQEIVPVAYIEIYESKSNQLIQSGITDDDGYFKINELSTGHFFVVVEFIGFDRKTIEDIYINREVGMKKNLGTISLDPKAIEIKEISIIDEMPTIGFETDKLVYTPSEDVLATGGSAEDVLNNVPMVLVDQDGAVSLKGSSNVKILVNGRENRMGEGGNDVDDIPASEIASVEVITSPSAKYDPEGMAGIINIVLKKGDRKGFYAQLKVFSKSNEFHDFDEMGGATVSGNYRKNKYNMYGSYSNKLNYRDKEGYRRTTTTYTDDNGILDDSIEKTDFNWLSSSKKNNQILRLGTDYYMNDQLTLNIESRYNAYYSSDESLETTILPEENEAIHSDVDPKGNYEVGLSFSADQRYDNPDRNLSLFYSFDRHPIDKEYDIIKDGEHQDTTFINSTLQSQEFRSSYSHPLNQKSKLEIGYEFDQTDNYEQMEYFLHVHSNELTTPSLEEEPHIGGLNTYGYKRSIHGAFIEYNAELNSKWSIKPGLRFEYVNKNIQFTGKPDVWYCGTQDTFDSYEACDEACDYSCELTGSSSDELGAYAQMLKENNDTDVKDEYTSVYPSFHITYNITEQKSIQFAISSRVERPGGGHHGGSRQIRPFPREVHSDNFIFLGDPNLEPEYSTNYEFSYKSPIMSKSSQPIGFLSTNVHYEDIRDKIEWYSSNEYEDFDVLTFRNADKAKGYGLELFFMIFGQTLGGGYWYNEVQDGSDDAELNGSNSGLNSYGKINLPERYMKYFGFEFGYYYMKMIDNYGSMFGDKGSIWANLGFTKSLLKKKGKLSFKIDNIFDSGGFSMNRTKPLILGIDYIKPGYSGGEEYTDMLSTRNGRTYSITFQYNFGDRKEKHESFRENQNRGGGIDMGM